MPLDTPRFDPNPSQLLVGNLQLLNLLPQHLNLSFLIKIHQTPMIGLMLNNLNLSLENGAGICVIRNLWRASLSKVPTNGIRYKVEGVTLGMVTFIMESSLRLDPGADRSKSLMHTMTWSQNPSTTRMRTL